MLFALCFNWLERIELDLARYVDDSDDDDELSPLPILPTFLFYKFWSSSTHVNFFFSFKL